jgi:membrane-associated protease RseP (regulator of RpoE activity)
VEEDRTNGISELVGDVFQAETVEIRKGSIRLRGSLLAEPDRVLLVLGERLKEKGLTPMLSRRGGEILLTLARLRPQAEKPRPQLNLLLFLLTILTTLFAGSLWRSEGLTDALLNLDRGAPFSISLLLILGAHELGHFFVARRMGIDATLPYFIPVPHFIGTFGAVIRIRSPIPNRRALVLMGAAGPLTGMLVAIPLTILGLKLSQVVTIEEVEGGLVLGSSFIFSLFERLAFSHLTETQGVFLHPMAFAGWLGMFVTGLNLLPIGQLDGGHIAYSILGRAHRKVGLIFLGVLVSVGVLFRFYAYALFGILILVVGFKHPPPLDDVTPLSFAHRGVALLAMLVLVLTFVPQPFILR